MPALSILIKPASNLCNLNCEYCFYRAMSRSRPGGSFGVMSDATLEALVKNALDCAEELCVFAFQGGEPTLCGLGFYQKLVELQEKHNHKHIKIENTIQTNGILIDDEWADFLGAHDFLVGLSLDGPRKINDHCRVSADGSGAFERIMDAAACLKRHDVPFNVLSVITARAAESPDHLYRFFKKQEFPFLQFIPCLAEAPGAVPAYSLRPGQYGAFLSRVFDLWYQDFIAGAQIDIRFFSNLVQMAAGYRPEACGMCGRCVPYPVVEGDGGVYPCDFYVTEQWRLGTVKEKLTDLLMSRKAQEFTAISESVDSACRECGHFDLCRGGCRRWREPVTNGQLSLNCLCGDYKQFFDHCKPRIRELARRYLCRSFAEKGT